MLTTIPPPPHIFVKFHEGAKIDARGLPIILIQKSHCGSLYILGPDIPPILWKSHCWQVKYMRIFSYSLKHIALMSPYLSPVFPSSLYFLQNFFFFLFNLKGIATCNILLTFILTVFHTSST